MQHDTIHDTLRSIGGFLGILFMLNGFRVLGGLVKRPAGKIVARGLWGFASNRWFR